MATIGDLSERIAIVETTIKLGFEHLGDRLDKLTADLAEQGRTPPPPPPRGWKLALAPGSGREIAIILLGLAGLIGGPVAGVLLQSESAASSQQPAPPVEAP